jgi:uncharacterized protein YpbB
MSKNQTQVKATVPAETKLEKLQKKAAALNITLNGDETEAQIEEAINLVKEANNKETVIFYWVKVKSFINDTETVEPGLYRVSENIARLDNSQPQYVESFTDSIPDYTLHKIAESKMVKIYASKDGKSIRPSDEILEEMVKTI